MTAVEELFTSWKYGIFFSGPNVFFRLKISHAPQSLHSPQEISSLNKFRKAAVTPGA